MAKGKVYGKIKGPYKQESVRSRIEALFLENIGKIITRAQILEVAKDPETNQIPENWHQRLSELRTDSGYTILSRRDTKQLKVSEYLLPYAKKRPIAAKRVKPAQETWKAILKRADYRCEWAEGEVAACGLRDGERDPVGGGTVRLTPDHRRPHAVSPNADPHNPDAWQALCGRHQVMKKNYWDDSTGWLNVPAIVQAASENTKRQVYDFLKSFFNE